VKKIYTIKKHIVIRKLLIAAILLFLFINVGCINKEQLKSTFGDGSDLDADISANNSVLTVEGTASAEYILEAIVDEFSADYEIEMSIDEPSVVLDNIIEGESDIAIFDNLDPEAADIENTEVLTEDSLFIIVNKENPEKNIDSDELSDLITDQIDTFGDSETNAHLFLPEDGTANWNRLLSLFSIESYSDDFELIDVTLPPTATVMENDDAIVKQVAKEIDALGVVGSDTKIKDVKVLTIDSYSPENESYPGKIQLLLLAKNPESDFAKSIFEFIKSEQAMSILSECGFTSVK